MCLFIDYYFIGCLFSLFLHQSCMFFHIVPEVWLETIILKIKENIEFSRMVPPRNFMFCCLTHRQAACLPSVSPQQRVFVSVCVTELQLGVSL